MSSKARVLYVAHSHPDFTAGGGELAAHFMYKAMRPSARYEPHLLAGAYDPDAFQRGRRLLRHERDETTQLFLVRDLRLDYPFHVGADLTVLGEYLRRLCPDVVHFHHYLGYGVDLIAYARALLPQARVLLTLHEFGAICTHNGSMVKTEGGRLCYQASAAECHRCFPNWPADDFFVREQLFKHNFALVDRFITPSRFLKDRYVAWGLDAGRILVMDNGRPPWPTRRRSPRGPGRAFVAGFFGQVTPFKGLDVFLDAAAEYLRLRARKTADAPELRFAIYGVMRTLPDDLQQHIDRQRKRCANVAQFHGGYAPQQLPDILAAVDCVVVPSRWWENSPLVIQESFMAGVPVVCSNVGGLAEKVTDRVNGLHFLVGDPRDLLDKLVELAASPELYGRLVEGIPAVLSDAEMARALHVLYDELLSEPSVCSPRGAGTTVSDLVPRQEYNGRIPLPVGGRGLPQTVAPTAPGSSGPGAVDRAFAADWPYLFVEGWFAATRAGLRRVTLADEHGAVAAAPAGLHFEERPDVLEALKGKLPQGHTAVGYALLIDASGVGLPATLRLEATDGTCFAAPLTEHQLTPASDEEKRSVREVFGAARAPSAAVHPAGQIEAWCRLDDQVAVAVGWLALDEETPTELAVTLVGGRAPAATGQLITRTGAKTDNPGQPRSGFAVTFQTDTGPPLCLSFRDALGNSRNVPFPRLFSGRDEVFGQAGRLFEALVERNDLPPDRRRRAATFLYDLLTDIRAAVLRESRIVRDIRLGGAPPAPAVSIVVPVGKYHAGLTHLQLLKLSVDLSGVEQELVFVAKAGPDAAAHEKCLARAWEMYGTASRLLVLSSGAGFAHAANLGASVAASPYLLFMAPQAVPASRHWLRTMLEALPRESPAGVVGACLLSPDQSVHHAGLGWGPNPRAGEPPVMLHLFRGLGRGLVPHSGVVDVPAVGAGCLLVSASVFAALGMFDPHYLGAEFPGCDLCRRVRGGQGRVVCDHRPLLSFADSSDEPPMADVRFHHFNAARYHNLSSVKPPEEVSTPAHLA